MTDLSALYTDQQARIVALVGGLPADQLAIDVPGCPRWTVRDVVCHLAGVVESVLTDSVPVPPTAEWTDGHVDQRRDLPLAAVFDEWAGRTPELLGRFPTLSRLAWPLVLDTVVHEDDIREALGLPYGDGPAAATALPALGRVIGRRVDEAGLPPLRLRATDTDATVDVGTGDEPPVEVVAGRDELYRTLAGRRTRRQATAMTWSADPAPYLDLLPLFGWREG